MKERRLAVLGWICFAVICAVGAAIYILLPDTLAVQISAGGQAGNTAPKLIYLIIFTSAALVVTLLNQGASKSGNTRWIAVSVILCALQLAVLIMNLTYFKGAF